MATERLLSRRKLRNALRSRPRGEETRAPPAAEDGEISVGVGGAPSGAREDNLSPVPEAGRHDAFVSYAREDKSFVADALVPSLETRGHDLWVDLTGIPPAADWRSRIEAAVEASKAFVFVLSPDSVSSDECEREWRLATELHKKIVPVLRRDVEPEQIAPELRAPNWIFLRDDDDFDAEIGRLVDALETDLEWRDMHARLSARAHEWVGAERDRSFLLRGSDLHAAEKWLAGQASHRESPTPLQQEYISLSRRVATRRQRIALGSALAALVAVSVLAVVALLQRSQAVTQAQIAQSRELAASSTSQLDADPELSLLLGAEAARVAPTAQASTALRLALSTSRLDALIPMPADPASPPSQTRDGRFVIQASTDRVARVWDWRSRQVVSTLRGHRDGSDGIPITGDTPLTAAFSPDGRLAVTAGDDGLLQVWDWRAQRVVKSFRPRVGALQSVAFSADGRQVLVGTDGQALALDWRSGRQERIADLGFDKVAEIAPHPADTRVAVAALDRVQVFELGVRKAVADLPSEERGAVMSAVGFSPDGRHVVTGDLDGGTEVWDLRREERVAREEGAGSVSSARFSPDGQTVAVARGDGRVLLWDWRGNRKPLELRGHRGAVSGALFAGDGSTVVSAGNDRTLRRWSVPGQVGVFGADVDTVAFGTSPDTVASGGVEGLDDGLDYLRVAQVWDLEARQAVARLPAQAASIGDLAAYLKLDFSRDGRLLAGGTDQGVVQVSDWRRQRTLARMYNPGGRLGDVALSPDGDLVATTSTDRVTRIWRWRDRRVEAMLPRAGEPQPGALEGSVAFHPGGEKLIASDGSTAIVWDWRKRRRIAQLRTATPVVDVDVSSNGRYVAAASTDGVTRVWDWQSGEVLAELRGDGRTMAAEFGPDGGLILTAESDGGARVWEWAVEQRVAQFQEPASPDSEFDAGTQDAAFSPDGRRVVAAGGDSRLHVYGCDVCAPLPELQALARRRVTRELTPVERRRYLHENR